MARDKRIKVLEKSLQPIDNININSISNSLMIKHKKKWSDLLDVDKEIALQNGHFYVDSR